MTAKETLDTSGHGVYAKALAEANRAFNDKVRELSALRRIADALAGAVDLMAILDKTLEIVIEEIGPENCSVMLMADGEERLLLRAARGADDRKGTFFDVDTAPPPLDTAFGIAGYALSTGRVVLVRDVADEPRYVSRDVGVPIGSMLVAPLIYGGKRLGVLNMSSATSQTFDEDSERLVTILVGLVATAIQNALLVEQLLAKERLSSLGRLAATMVHDMRSPVTVIYGFASLLAEADTSDADRGEYLAIIKKQLSLFQSLAEETLEYVRGDETKLVSTPILLSHLALALKESMSPTCTEKRVALSCDVAVDGTIMGDESKLIRALVNLVGNALDAISPPEGKVTVHFGVEKGTAIITVADNGKGIAEKDLPRIFDPFVTKGKTNGTGLGLAIVRRIVEAHRGNIDVVSTVKVGTTFVVTLPTAS